MPWICVSKYDYDNVPGQVYQLRNHNEAMAFHAHYHDHFHPPVHVPTEKLMETHTLRERLHTGAFSYCGWRRRP